MKLNKFILGYYSFLFIAFGCFGLVKPQFVAELLHYDFSSPIAKLDFVSMYGGLFIGLGLFFAFCLKRDVYLGLVSVLFTMGAMFVTRAYEFISLGQADLVQYVYLGGELFTVILISILLYMSASQKKESSVGSMA